jgi:hypothetical protein
MAERAGCGGVRRRRGAHVSALTEFADAGFGRIRVNQRGADQRGLVDFCRTAVLPGLPP